MKTILLATTLLSACASAPPPSPPPAPAAATMANTTACLDNPELSRNWGDCNVKFVVYQASSQFERCQRKHPGPTGQMHFQLKLKPNGSVASAKALDGQPGKLTSCVTKVFRSLQFAPPPAGKTATIVAPFEIAP